MNSEHTVCGIGVCVCVDTVNGFVLLAGRFYFRHIQIYACILSVDLVFHFIDNETP